MSDCRPNSPTSPSDTSKERPLPQLNPSDTSKTVTATYRNTTSLISGPQANRTHKTEQERAQGPAAKTSTLTAKGKAALKGKAKVDVNEPRKPSNRELAYLFRATGRVLDYTSKLPSPKSAKSNSSSKSSSPRSHSSSSCSHHSSVSSGPAFALPQSYTSLSDVAEVVKFNNPSPPKSPPRSSPHGGQKPTHFGASSLREASQVSAPRRPNTTAVRSEPAVKATNKGTDRSSKVGSSKANVPNAGVQAGQHSGATSQHREERRHNNWGNLRRKPDNELPELNQINFRVLKTVADVRKLKIFPSALTLRNQERLCSLLDELNHEANTVACEFVKSKIRSDTLKSIHYLFLIGNKGKIHFFNPLGHYVGQVVVNEPTWFFGRPAGSNRNMYLSMGSSKTSKCFLKSRFPTLAEFISNDWAKGKSSLKHVTVFDPVKGRNWKGDRGFCWLPLYLNSQISLAQYPTGGLVRLFTLYDKFGPVPILKTGKYYHYDVNGKRHIKFPNVWVGAEENVNSSDITTWEDCNSDPMLRTAVDSVLKRTALKETSNFQNNIDSLFDKALTHSLNSTKNEKLTISQHLTAEEFELLKSYFGLPYLGNGNTPRNPHSLLNAMRECYNKLYSRAFRGVSVSDIGGNLATTIFSDCSNTHVCLPLLDVKDSARQTRSAIALFNSLEHKQSEANLLAKRLQTLDNVSYCHHAVPNCSVRSTAVIMVDVYDMSLKSLIKAMEKKGALISRCCFMFPPELLNTDGVIVHPETNVVVTRAGQTLSYNIANTSDTYTHNVDCVLSFLKANTVRSSSGFVYSVELVNQNGPYMDFQVALCTNNSSKPSTRSYQAWLKNKSTVIVQKVSDCGDVQNMQLIMDRDFVRRVLSYSANVCNTLDDRTYEYVLSNIRSQTTMMIVGSKIVHNKVDISNDVIVELPGTFLKEAVKRRRRAVEQAKKSNSGFFKKLLGKVLSVPRMIISSLISLLRKLLPKSLRSKFDDLLNEPSLISDCADIVVTETSNEAGTMPLKNDILADVLQAVKDLTLLSAPEPEITEDNEESAGDFNIVTPGSKKQKGAGVSPQQRGKGGLRGGGNNWYDFLLPSKASKNSGSSFLATMWRLVRKLDIFFRNSSVMQAVLRLLKLILRSLKAVLAPLLLNPLNFFTFKKAKPSPARRAADTLKSVFGSFIEHFIKIIDNSLFGKIFRVFVEAKDSVIDNFQCWRNELSDSVVEGLKTRIACGMKSLGLKPPKDWLKESSIAKLVMDKLLSDLKGLPLFPLASAVLITLVASKTVREKILGFTNRVVCFIESIRIKRPIFLCSILLGGVMKNLSRLSFLLTPFDECKEVCVGMLFSNLLNCAYATYHEPGTLRKVELLTNFIIFQRNLGMLTSIFALEKVVKDDVVATDVADIDPNLSSFELNEDVEDIINNFKLNVEDLKQKKANKMGVVLERGECSGSKPDVNCQNNRGKAVQSGKRAGKVEIIDSDGPQQTEDIGINSKAVTVENKPAKSLKAVEKKPTDVPVSESEKVEKKGRVESSYIKLEEDRQPLFSKEDLEATINVSPAESKQPAHAETPKRGLFSELSEHDIDKVIDQFNSELESNFEQVDYKQKAKLEVISDSDSDTSESSLAVSDRVEVINAVDTDSDSVRSSTDEFATDVSHISCGCGVNIAVKPFKVPGPLPLVRGDVLKGREAWFYSRQGDSYSYVGGSHKSRGWLNILNKFISSTGLHPAIFNHCLVQRYAAGAGIPYHKDNEAVYPKNNPILTIHLSGEGTFFVRCKTSSAEVQMTNPCWFVMPFGFQVSHQHSVTCATTRVSLTFRSTEVITSLSQGGKSLELVVRDEDTSHPKGKDISRKVIHSEEKPLSLRPQTLTPNSVRTKSCGDSLMQVCSKATGVTIKCVDDFLDIGTYKNMKHYVTISGNVGAVVEAFLYNLHELHKEVSVLVKALNQPDILVGKRREVYCSSVPDMDRIQVCKQPEMLLTASINSMYGIITSKSLVFSNDKCLRAEDSVLYLTPANLSFPLRRSIGMFKMMSILAPADIERALVGCKFINAVPGAGKTYEIKALMKSHAQNERSRSMMLVLTSSRNAAETLNEYWDAEICDKRVVVMTVDSFIFSGGKFSEQDIEAVMIDECYMSHAGLCILIAAITNPSTLCFYGDRRQVPFVNRNPIFRDTMGMLKTSAGEYSERLLTYRCPADICYWMSTVDFLKPGGRLYSGKVQTVKDGRPLKSVTTKPFSPDQLNFFKSADRVMTFTQMEKNDLISKFQTTGFGGRAQAEELIGTVAESQGETYGKVVLVRTKAADDPVFNSFPHRLVALTRHTVSLEFICLPTKMSKGIGADCKMIEKLESSVAKSFVVQHHV
nr:methytransferase/helicase [Grapevine leafroll-associated virus 4]